MGEQTKTNGNRNMHAIILGVLGILFVIVGEYIINVHGAPLRGSGAGHSLNHSGHISAHNCRPTVHL